MWYISSQTITILIILLIQKNINCKNNENFRNGTRFKSIKCDCNTTIATVKYCFLKPVSRQVVTLNVGVIIHTAVVKPIYTQLVIHYRYGTVYRQVLDTHPLEWCGIMDGSATHPLMALIIEQLKGSAPTLFHKCPYIGDLDLSNVTIDRSKNVHKSSIFPEGTYRGELSFAKNEILIYKVTLSFELKSPLKESFG